MSRTTLLIVFLALCGASAGFLAGGAFRGDAGGAGAALVGAPRPALALPDLDGRERSLDEWDGQVVLVNFWASWCGPCREEMPALDRVQKTLDARGLRTVGIAIDDADDVRAFLADARVDYPILLDASTDDDSSVAYGNDRHVLPYSVLIDRDGRIVDRHFGGFDEAALRAWVEKRL